MVTSVTAHLPMYSKRSWSLTITPRYFLEDICEKPGHRRHRVTNLPLLTIHNTVLAARGPVTHCGHPAGIQHPPLCPQPPHRAVMRNNHYCSGPAHMVVSTMTTIQNESGSEQEPELVASGKFAVPSITDQTPSPSIPAELYEAIQWAMDIWSLYYSCNEILNKVGEYVTDINHRRRLSTYTKLLQDNGLIDYSYLECTPIYNPEYGRFYTLKDTEYMVWNRELNPVHPLERMQHYLLTHCR